MYLKILIHVKLRKVVLEINKLIFYELLNSNIMIFFITFIELFITGSKEY